MTKRLLTHKQQIVLDFLQRYFLEHHGSPLIREVQAGCQINSYKSTLDRLNALERKGYIKRIPNKHYGIRLLKPALEEPAASALQETPSPLAVGEAA